MFKTRLSSAALLAAVLSSSLTAQTTTRVSVDSLGVQGNGPTDSPGISADGRWVVFSSESTNLVADDTNSLEDVFLHDRLTGETRRVSVGLSGAEADGASIMPTISADGSTVAFSSLATNLVATGGNPNLDVYVYDVDEETTELISLSPAGAPANNASLVPSLSEDGLLVVFASDASNLVDGDTNSVRDVFLHDRLTGVTERVNLDSAEQEANGNTFEGVISADGRFVAFASAATNLVPGDTNARDDIFLRDRTDGTTIRVSVGLGGVEANNSCQAPRISGNGNQVVFSTNSTNLDSRQIGFVNSFLYDRAKGYAELVGLDSCGTPPDIAAAFVEISGNGRYVAFQVAANNWEETSDGIHHSFVRDLRLGTTVRISQASDGTPASVSSQGGLSVSDQGHATFLSPATNLDGPDTNNTADLFVHEARTGIWLDIWNDMPSIGEAITLAAYGGGPGAPGMLFVSSVNGAPVSGGLLPFLYDPDGIWIVTATLNNPQASGLRLGFTTFGLTCEGKLTSSEEVFMDVQ